MNENENDLDPELVLKLVATDVPRELQPNLLVVGSLAAAYHHRASRGRQPVKTKDADVVVQPAGAIEQCRDIAERLLDARWRHTEKCWPSQAPTPEEDLRIIRLYPPDNDLYFVELLGLPASGQKEAKHLEPCQLRDGWYAVPCFRYMAVLSHDRQRSELGIEYASPALMALANLLAHPALGTQMISGTRLLRSSKDLGRVLALYFLASNEEASTWPTTWWTALQEHFPAEALTLAARVGDGVKALLDSTAAFEDAFELVNGSLLSGRGVTRQQLRIAAQRLMNDVVDELQEVVDRARSRTKVATT